MSRNRQKFLEIGYTPIQSRMPKVGIQSQRAFHFLALFVFFIIGFGLPGAISAIHKNGKAFLIDLRFSYQ